MNQDEAKNTIWKIIGGITIAAVMAAVGFTWSTYTTTNEMKIQLSGLCTALPEVKARVEKLDIEVQMGKMTDVEVKGRLFFLETKLKDFEDYLRRKN